MIRYTIFMTEETKASAGRAPSESESENDNEETSMRSIARTSQKIDDDEEDPGEGPVLDVDETFDRPRSSSEGEAVTPEHAHAEHSKTDHEERGESSGPLIPKNSPNSAGTRTESAEESDTETGEVEGSIFLMCNVYCTTDSMCSMIKNHGGTAFMSAPDETTTHIVADEIGTWARWMKYHEKKAWIVTPEWVEQCIKEGTRLAESNFRPTK